MTQLPQKFRRQFALAGLAALTAIPTGCPTWRTEHKVETTHKIEAHIVLDIRQVRDEARQVEDDIRSTAPPATKPQSSAVRIGEGRVVASRSLSGIFDLSGSAMAADDEKGAKERRQKRYPKIDAHLSKGTLGENNKGVLEARGSDDEAKGLIAEENADRKIMYSAAAVRQGLPASDWVAIGEIYAVEIPDKLKAGQSFQAPSKEKLFKEFKQTKVGKALSTIKAGEWAKVP